MHPEFVDNMKKCVNPKDKVNPNNPDNLDEISKSEIAAVHRFLVAEVRPFGQEVIAESQLRMLLGRPENIVYGELKYRITYEKFLFIFIFMKHFCKYKTSLMMNLTDSKYCKKIT